MLKWKKFFFRLFIPLLILGGGMYTATNTNFGNNIVNRFTVTNQFLVIANPDGTLPTDVSVCNIPLDPLLAGNQGQTLINAISQHSVEACLGTLGPAIGTNLVPPMLGDNRGLPLINVRDFQHDLRSGVTNNILICQVPCSHPRASEIETCLDYSHFPNPNPYVIQAQGAC